MNGSGERLARSASVRGPDGQTQAGLPVVEATGITKRYGSTTALDRATITVQPGQTHALVGRNGAGKSTLVAILTGLVAPDSGEVTFSGDPAPRLSDRSAWRSRVACVYQKTTIIGELTVAENLLLNRYQRGRHGLINWSGMRRRAAELLAAWAPEVDVRARAGDLSLEQRQFVEIARALSFGARFIVLDEPTAQLDAAAIGRLFARMRDLSEQGVTFLYISHHLEEIYQICDCVTVVRDGRDIVTASVSELPRGRLIAAMTGDAGALQAPRSRPVLARNRPVVLEVANLMMAQAFRDVSFQVHAGEIVGLAGSGSSGKTALAETIVGLRAPEAGSVALAGRRLKPGDVSDALAAGVGYLPQDRHRQGLVPEMSIADNGTLTIPQRLGAGGFLSPRRRDAISAAMIEDLAIKAPGPRLPVSGLSGGNQQKVVMGRALANQPQLLVLITPTAGVDVRSKEFLLAKVEQVADAGTAVVIASDEIDDLRLCDRILVLVKGDLVAELAQGWSDHDLVAAMEGVTTDA